MEWRYQTKSEKFKERIKKECVWHYWFAWYPVSIEHQGKMYRVWLQKVGRRKKAYTSMGEMYDRRNAIGYPEYCFAEQTMINKLQNPEIWDERDTRMT